MAFKIENSEKIIKSWLQFIEPMIKNSNSVAILGFGNGKHISDLIQKYTLSEIHVVDPSTRTIETSFLNVSMNFHYYTKMNSITILKRILQNSIQPIPVLCFRPCWNSDSLFFESTLTELIAEKEIKNWNNSTANFILESLFL